MVEIRQNLVSKDKYGIKCPYAMTPKYVVIHNTANDAPAENEVAYMHRNDNDVSFHYAADDKEIVQGIPEDRNAWHAGDGGKGEGNRCGIAIEICWSKSGGAKFDAAEKNAAELAASILKRYGWGLDRLKTHRDFNGKNCPHRTLANGWQRFVDMVAAHLAEDKPAEKAPETANTLKVGDVVYFKGGKHYKSADAATGSQCAAGWAKITAAAKGAHPYHLVRTGKSGPWGWVDAEAITGQYTPKVGDVVYFEGGKHYKSADAATGSQCAAGAAKITATAKGAHPYHLVKTGKSGPWGWVDAGTFTKADK